MKMKKILSISFAILGMLTIFTACSNDDDDTPKYDDITLAAGEYYVIEGEKNWLSEEPLIASISENTINAKRVGKTKISNEKSSFNVTVTPKYNLYYEPCMQWGASKSTVNSFMKGYELNQQDTEGISYYGKGAVEMYAYLFKNNKLTSSAVLLDAEKYLEAVANFINERYVYTLEDEDNYAFYFVNIEKDMAVMVSLNSLGGNVYIMVLYYPVDLSDAKTRGNLNLIRKIGKSPVKNETAEKYFNKLQQSLKK